jgi:hypothetical protein
MGKPESKGPLQSRRRGWEDNIKTGFKETGWGSVDWIHPLHDMEKRRAVVKMVIKLRVA